MRWPVVLDCATKGIYLENRFHDDESEIWPVAAAFLRARISEELRGRRETR
jgi:hypothetical protein